MSTSARQSGAIVVVPRLERAFITIYVTANAAASLPHWCGDALPPEIVTVGQALGAMAEPLSRPRVMHEYRITPFSLGAAVARNVTAAGAHRFLHTNALTLWDDAVVPATSGDEAALSEDPVFKLLFQSMSSYGRARIVLDNDRCAVEFVSRELAEKFRTDAVIASQSKPNIYDIEARDDGDDIDGEATAAAFVSGFELIDAAARKFVADRALSALGIPLMQQYAFSNDGALPRMYLSLRTSTKPRLYQERAVEAAVGAGTCSSGVIVLPCGAGKTLVGIMSLCAVGRPAIILCASSVSVEQWKNQILDFAGFDQQAEAEEDAGRQAAAQQEALSATTEHQGSSGAPITRDRQRRLTGAAAGVNRTMVRPAAERVATRIACFTGKNKDKVTEYTRIIVTTYSMLSVAHRAYAARQVLARTAGAAAAATGSNASGSARSANASAQRSRETSEALFRPEGWGLLLLDEVHVAPADFFREALGALKAKATIGLTATFVREDAKIMDLHHLVGPKLYDASWEDLQAQGFLADVTCVEVHCRMVREFGVEYFTRRRSVASTAPPQQPEDAATSTRHAIKDRVSSPLLVALAAANPNKMCCALALVARHRGAKTIVFCDFIQLLKRYADVLGCPAVHGDTPHAERLKIFSDFESTNRLNLILVSRVGDVSVNLPSASIVIQVSSHGGSRRQEAQRLGRILRPKPKNIDGTSVHAFFYSLVSDDTIEASYAAHRTAFLVDQGYTCRLETYRSPLDAPGAADAASDDDLLPCLQRRPRLEWLARVVAQWEMARFSTAPSARGGGGDRQGTTEGADEDESSLSEDEEGNRVEAVGARVKRERDGADGAARRRPAVRSEAGSATGLAALTTADDGVVYHEFN